MGLIKNLAKAIVSTYEEKESGTVVVAETIEQPQAHYPNESSHSMFGAWSVIYNGEKNTDELGPIIDYKPDYQALRARSWQSWIESEITKTVIGRYVKWVVGEGLKLQASPNIDVLLTEGFSEFTPEARTKFANAIESRMKIWWGSRFSTYAGNHTLSAEEKEAVKMILVGGDGLVILRLDKGNVTVQIIDGAHIKTPPMVGALSILANGNRIINGVEIDAKGTHIAYHVVNHANGIMPTFERVEAFNKATRQRMAFMIYGSKYRIDSVRGMPLVAVVLETLKKLERYKEATVGSAEERAKIVYQIVHTDNSTGESPLLKKLAHASGRDGDLPTDSNGIEMARKVAVSTQKQTFNMTQGSELKALESKVELNFEGFYDKNFDIICAVIGIPPNVAKMLYDSNFSAARAALKDWEHTLRVDRSAISEQLHVGIYEFFTWVQVLSGKVKAPGYLEAYASKNMMALAAFHSSRWIGAAVPHIDPLKEAKAEREKMGPLGINVPLTTPEQATESLGTGESSENFVRFAEELKWMKEADLKTETEVKKP